MFDAYAPAPPSSFTNEVSGDLSYLSDAGTNITSTAAPILTPQLVAVGNDEALPLANASDGTDECHPSLEVIETVQRESEIAREFCTSMMRLVFSKEGMKDRNTSGRRVPRDALNKSKLDKI